MYQIKLGITSKKKKSSKTVRHTAHSCDAAQLLKQFSCKNGQ